MLFVYKRKKQNNNNCWHLGVNLFIFLRKMSQWCILLSSGCLHPLVHAVGTVLEDSLQHAVPHG